MTKRDEEIYTWQQFDEDIEKIAQWAKDKNFKIRWNPILKTDQVNIKIA